MEKKNSYTIPLTPAQMEAAAEILRTGNYRMRTVQYAIAAAEGPDCQIAVYSRESRVKRRETRQRVMEYTVLSNTKTKLK